MNANTAAAPDVDRHAPAGQVKGDSAATAQHGAPQREALLQLLEEWRRDEDIQEQRETWEYLRAALNESRARQRKLVP
jgi:hypothetical protein